jgi:hypothetical protein
MDKKNKQRRHKTLDQEELEEVAPRGASFDTEEGRAAQGMRPDIGAGRSDEERQRDETKGAVGAADGKSDAGNAAGEAVARGDAEDDHEKLLPEATTKTKKDEELDD